MNTKGANLVTAYTNGDLKKFSYLKLTFGDERGLLQFKQRLYDLLMPVSSQASTPKVKEQRPRTCASEITWIKRFEWSPDGVSSVTIDFYRGKSKSGIKALLQDLWFEFVRGLHEEQFIGISYDVYTSFCDRLRIEIEML